MTNETSTTASDTNRETCDYQFADNVIRRLIVFASLENGQRTQAEQQCESYGLVYVELLAQFNSMQ